MDAYNHLTSVNIASGNDLDLMPPVNADPVLCHHKVSQNYSELTLATIG